MLFEKNEPPDTKESVEAAKQQADRLVRMWDERAIYAGAAFALSCAAVYPFLYGHSLHTHWESFGKYLVLLCMALLIPCIACIGTAVSTRVYRRDLDKIEI